MNNANQMNKNIHNYPRASRKIFDGPSQELQKRPHRRHGSERLLPRKSKRRFRGENKRGDKEK